MRRPTIWVLLFTLFVAPAQAGPAGFSLVRAAREEALRQAAAQPPPATGMSPAMKWTGIGLLIGGGFGLATGVLADDACLDNGEYDEDFCDDLQTAWIAAGAAAAGTGAVLLMIGSRRQRQSAPSLTLGAKRVSWRIRF